MPAAAARRAGRGGPPAAPAGLGRDGSEARRSPRTRTQQSLEQRILLTATLCLLAFGAVMVYSASSATTLLQGRGNGSGYLVRYLLYGSIGLLIMRLLARDGVRLLTRITGPLLAASFVLVLAVHVPHIGVSVNGARRWLGTGPLQFQPSELMKLALVLYAAALLARQPQRVHDLRELVNPLLVVVAAAVLLIGTQPDLGTALVIAFTVTAILVAAGVSLRTMAVIAGAAFAVVVLYALVRPYARARLTSFLDPWAHAAGSGFQAVQGQIAIGSGGLFGVGPGQSVQKIFYLPEAPTDFILAVIAEELGVVGVRALVFLYGLIGYAGLRAARGARSLYSALIAVGVTALILSQAILNAFAVLGLAPLTGVPLPFVSYGSSSMILMLGGMRLVLNLASGATGHLRAVEAPRRTSRGGSGRSTRAAGGRSSRDAARAKATRWNGVRDVEEDRDRRRRDRRARGAGARGGRRAAG